MPNAQVPVGIGAPNALTQTINVTDVSGLEDLTTVTGVSLNVLRADGSTATWVATIVSATTTTLEWSHTFASTDTIPDPSAAPDGVVGSYKVVPVLTVPGGTVPCYARVLIVTDPYGS